MCNPQYCQLNSKKRFLSNLFLLRVFFLIWFFVFLLDLICTTLWIAPIIAQGGNTFWFEANPLANGLWAELGLFWGNIAMILCVAFFLVSFYVFTKWVCQRKGFNIMFWLLGFVNGFYLVVFWLHLNMFGIV